MYINVVMKIIFIKKIPFLILFFSKMLDTQNKTMVSIVFAMWGLKKWTRSLCWGMKMLGHDGCGLWNWSQAKNYLKTHLTRFW
jgi:hypothetical protein